MIYVRLIFEFFKTGLFAIGGGLATIPFLYEISARLGWFTREFLGDMIAISESTPGPIGVNVATYAGFTTAGVWGSVCSTLGLVAPSVIVILIIGKMFDKFQNNLYVQRAFYGIRPVVCGMIASVALGLIGTALLHTGFDGQLNTLLASIDIRAVILFFVFLVSTNKWKLHPIFYIVAAGVLGAVLKL